MILVRTFGKDGIKRSRSSRVVSLMVAWSLSSSFFTYRKQSRRRDFWNALTIPKRIGSSLHPTLVKGGTGTSISAPTKRQSQQLRQNAPLGTSFLPTTSGSRASLLRLSSEKSLKR